MYILEKNLKSKLAKSHFKEFNIKQTKNGKEVSNEYNVEIKKLVRLFDLHYKIAAFYVPMLQLYLGYSPSVQKLMVTSVWGNIHTIQSAMQLAIAGQVGSARTLMRKAFEFLMIGKFCGITENELLANNWFEGRNIDLYKVTMKNLILPDNTNIIKLWRLLCLYNHGTIYSTQLSNDWKSHSDEIRECIALCIMLIGCNNHLLKSVILRNNASAKYNSEYLRPNHTRILSSLYREQLKICKEVLSKNGRSFMYDYSRNWRYKN
jgi:hypothetical protein